MMRDLLSGDYIPFGSQYYRAPSPAEGEWDRDLANFASLGFNTVKLWVQWRWNNPRKGVYYFEDIDRLMELASKHGLRVMLNTIVDVAPAWIYREFPDASMLTLDGRRIGPQVQPHRQIGGLGLCLNHAPAMDHLFAFLRETFRRYATHPALEMWNVASEPELTSSMAEMRLYADDASKMGDMLCYCPRCRAAFTAWLGSKYGTIDALNLSWNRNYAGFDEVETPVTRNSFNDLIDWRMFFVHTLGENVRRRFEAAKEEDRGRHPLLSHHVFIQGFPVTSTANDPWNVAQYGDLHGITQMDDPMMCDVLRSAAGGKPVICAEMLMLYGYTLEVPKRIAMNDVKRFVFNGVAANLKGFIFWQYRPELLAREAPAWGLTFLDGSPTPWLKDFAEVNRVIQGNAGFLLDAAPRKAEVALLYSPENQVFGWAATGNEKNVTDSLLGAHRALYASNFVIDFVHPSTMTPESIAGYKAIVIPFPYYLDERTCSTLASWVEKGGVLVGEAYFAGWNREQGSHQSTVPGYGLHGLFGARQRIVSPPAEGGDVVITVTAELPGVATGTGVTGAIIQEALEPSGADVLGRFADGSPAITVSRHGKGYGILIGSYVALRHFREGGRANADLLSGLVDLKTVIRRPTLVDGSRVRVDLLSDGKNGRMLILRNLEERDVRTRMTVPGMPAGTLKEQFSAEAIEAKDAPAGAVLEVALAPGEVKVYRA
jgi:beta-galactosidase